jgi:hypothetical protein
MYRAEFLLTCIMDITINSFWGSKLLFQLKYETIAILLCFLSRFQLYGTSVWSPELLHSTRWLSKCSLSTHLLCISALDQLNVTNCDVVVPTNRWLSSLDTYLNIYFGISKDLPGSACWLPTLGINVNCFMQMAASISWSRGRRIRVCVFGKSNRHCARWESWKYGAIFQHQFAKRWSEIQVEDK